MTAIRKLTNALAVAIAAGVEIGAIGVGCVRAIDTGDPTGWMLLAVSLVVLVIAAMSYHESEEHQTAARTARRVQRRLDQQIATMEHRHLQELAGMRAELNYAHGQLSAAHAQLVLAATERVVGGGF